MNDTMLWRSRCLSELGKISCLASARCPRDAAPKGPRLDQVCRLLEVVVSRSLALRAEILGQIPAGRLQSALRVPAATGNTEIRGCFPVIHSVVGKLAILSRALDRLRDELVNCDDSEWFCFQMEICFDQNVKEISDEKVPEKQFFKEAAEAHAERFSDDLGDYKKAGAAIRKPASLSEEETARILEGLILSVRELKRDIGIHLTVIQEWMKRSELAQAIIRSVFRKEPPPVTGDGLTQETAWEFPLSRMQGEGVAMAHEFMQSKGPSHDLRKQALVEMDDENILEYWDTDAGRFWFRYRRDPRMPIK